MQAARFLVCGGAATVAHWAVMAWLMFLSVAPLPATAAGAAIGSVVNYLLQRHWVFAATVGHRQALPAYGGAVVFGWGLNGGIFWLLTTRLDLNAAVAQVCTSALVAIASFILYKKAVFHERTV